MNEELAWVREVCCGDESAVQFLIAWNHYVHRIDDVMDGHAPLQAVPGLLAVANRIYSAPFYTQHATRLELLVQVITCVFEDSIELADRTESWARRTADVIRHCGADMVRAVAVICGGYEHARRISPRLHEVAWAEHHEGGVPV